MGYSLSSADSFSTKCTSFCSSLTSFKPLLLRCVLPLCVLLGQDLTWLQVSSISLSLFLYLSLCLFVCLGHPLFFLSWMLCWWSTLVFLKLHFTCEMKMSLSLYPHPCLGVLRINLWISPASSSWLFQLVNDFLKFSKVVFDKLYSSPCLVCQIPPD